MTTNTEALRAQFEREIGEAAPFPVQRYGDSYAHRICAWAWEGYQAGHAAAKAETADVGEPAAWMAVLTHPRSQGPQAHFVSDARLASQWKYNGVVDGEPCIVQPLFTAPQLAAAVAQERERPSITLTTLEIADLAKFAGLLCGLPNRESREDQVTIEPCPEDGLRDDDEGEIWSSSWIAYMTEYPEEGSVTLGNTIRAGAKEPSDA